MAFRIFVCIIEFRIRPQQGGWSVIVVSRTHPPGPIERAYVAYEATAT